MTFTGFEWQMPRGMQAAREKAKITDWPQSCAPSHLRKDAYAHFKNVGATMAEMGHTNPKTFFRHYRARVQPKEAARYLQIKPERTSAKTEQRSEEDALATGEMSG